MRANSEDALVVFFNIGIAAFYERLRASCTVQTVVDVILSSPSVSGIVPATITSARIAPYSPHVM